MRNITLFSLSALLISYFINITYAENEPITVDQVVQDLNGGRIELGDTLRYTVTVINDGPDALNNVSVTSTFPSGATYVENTLHHTGGGVVTVGASPSKQVTYDWSEMDEGAYFTLSYEVVVSGSPLYLVDNIGFPAILYSVDKVTGKVQTLDRIEGEKNVYAAALSSDGRYLYGVNSIKNHLFRYDTLTQDVVVVGNLEAGNVKISCLDFNYHGVLWGADEKGDRLFTIDPATGQATEQFDLGMNLKSGGCAFGADGKLYMVSNNNAKGKGALWVINTQTQSVGMVSSISEKEYVTGLAFDSDGQLLASGNKKDSLWDIDRNTGVGIKIGDFGSPHNDGDLATAASQSLRLTNVVTTTYAGGNTTSHEIEAEINGIAPPIGSAPGGEEPELEIIQLQQDYCLKHLAEPICILPINFVPFLNQYIDDVVQHHFGQVEAVAGEYMDVLGLEDQAAITYLSETNQIILADKEAADDEAHQMVQDWIDEYDNCGGKWCPHENQLLQNIRELLTHRQAESAVRVKRYNATSSSQMHCALYAQDSLIRIGDEISLGWDAYGGTEASIEPFVGSVDLSGTVRVRPLETNTFVLTLSNGSGQSIECSYTVVVQPACDIGAHSKVIKGGTSTTVFWNGEGHDSVTVDDVAVGPKGDQYITPTQTTTYTLKGYKSGQSEPLNVCTYTVEVVAPEDYCPDNPE